MLLTVVDATDRNPRAAAKDLLFGELRHRMKNLQAAAQSIARQTTTEGRSEEVCRDDFLGRFNALTGAQELVFAGQKDNRSGGLGRRILAPYRATPEAVAVEPGGGPVKLAAGTVQAIGPVLHDLATNAAKYGALSVAGGQVRVGWRTDGEKLHLAWVESGGPPVKAPTTTG